MLLNPIPPLTDFMIFGKLYIASKGLSLLIFKLRTDSFN